MDFVSVAGAIIAFIAAIATYRESARMRTTSVRPVLVPSDFALPLGGPAVSFDIVNIGNGPARSVRALWAYDLKTNLDLLTLYQEPHPHLPEITEYTEIFLAKDKSLTIWLPESFEWAVSAARQIISQADSDRQPFTFPSLSLTVHYKNIFGKSFKERFDVRVEFMREHVFLIKFSDAPIIV